MQEALQQIHAQLALRRKLLNGPFHVSSHLSQLSLSLITPVNTFSGARDRPFAYSNSYADNTALDQLYMQPQCALRWASASRRRMPGPCALACMHKPTPPSQKPRAPPGHGPAGPRGARFAPRRLPAPMQIKRQGPGPLNQPSCMAMAMAGQWRLGLGPRKPVHSAALALSCPHHSLMQKKHWPQGRWASRSRGCLGASRWSLVQGVSGMAPDLEPRHSSVTAVGLTVHDSLCCLLYPGSQPVACASLL